MDTPKSPTTISLDSMSTPTYTSQLNPHIFISDFLNPSPTSQFQYLSTYSHFNVTAVFWYTLSHQQLAMYPTIADLKRQYCDSCERTGHLSNTFWKIGLTLFLPHLHQQMQQYNINNGSYMLRLPHIYESIKVFKH